MDLELPAKSIRYNFAHIALPVLALWNPKKFHADVFRKDGGRYLNEIWKGLAGRMGLPATDSEFLLEIGKLRSGAEYCLITLPAPTETAEAFYVAATVNVEKHFFRSQITEPHYFTLELGLNVESGEDAYYVCEWLSPVPVPERNNYGTIPSPSKSLFVGVIDAVLLGEIKPESKNSPVERFEKQPRCGAVTFDEEGRATIIARDDFSPVHALGHITLREVYEIRIKAAPERRDDLDNLITNIETSCGIRDGRWRPEQEEIFVRQFELYVAEKSPVLEIATDGEHLSPVLRDVFEILCPLNRTEDEL